MHQNYSKCLKKCTGDHKTSIKGILHLHNKTFFYNKSVFSKKFFLFKKCFSLHEKKVDPPLSTQKLWRTLDILGFSVFEKPMPNKRCQMSDIATTNGLPDGRQGFYCICILLVNLGDAFRHLIMVDYEFCGANIEGFYFS
jgi:hypothetical protein